MPTNFAFVDPSISNKILKKFLDKLNEFPEINNSSKLVVDNGKIVVNSDSDFDYPEGADKFRSLMNFELIVLPKDNSYGIALIETFLSEEMGNRFDVSDIPIPEDIYDNYSIISLDNIHKRIGVFVGGHTEDYLNSLISLKLHCINYLMSREEA